MNWFAPEFLFFIFALPLLVLFFVWAFRRKRRLLERFACWEMVRRLAGDAGPGRQWAKAALLVLAAALLVVALARPQYGEVEREVVRKGLDIIVAIDVSMSMLATDMAPDRLTRAREQLGNLIDRVENQEGDRVGIMAFAGDAFLVCPLTVDYLLARRILETVDTNSISSQGTMIGQAIRAATRAFERSGSEGDRLLILLTDGEDQGSDPLVAADEAAEAGIRIYAIGIGSERGVPIELPDGTFKKDQDGTLVTSRLDFNTLQKVALKTGGKAIKAVEAGYRELDEVVSDIDQLKRARLTSKTYALQEDRFQWALAPALMLLLVETLIGDRRKKRKSWTGRFQ